MGKFLAALFGLPLALFSGLIGLIAFYIAASAVWDWNRMRSWQPVMAEVLDAQLKEVDGSYSGSGRYRYFIDNQAYTASRIDASDRQDFLQDWQIAIVEDLIDAKRRGRKVVVFADPKKPVNAIVDRDLDWQAVIPSILMGTGLLVFAFWVPKRIFRRRD